MPYKDKKKRAAWTKAYNKIWEALNPEKVLAKQRKYRAKNPEKVTEWNNRGKKKWRSRNIERSRMLTRGSVAVSNAIKMGVLTRPTRCSKCGNKNYIQAHHHKGYEKYNLLNVIWLCRSCHRSIHRPK